MRKVRDKPAPDAAIARLAANQHGVVATAQLAAAGLSPAAVARRLAAGRVHRLYRGVYAVGHPNVSERGRDVVRFTWRQVTGDRAGVAKTIRTLLSGRI